MGRSRVFFSTGALGHFFYVTPRGRRSIPRTLLIMPDVAVLWMVYEVCKNLFDGEEEEEEGQGSK